MKGFGSDANDVSPSSAVDEVSTKNEEPDFIAQTAEPMAEPEAIQWYRDRADEMRAHGATCIRAAYHPDNNDLRLVEGWKIWPSTQGAPRWMLSASPKSEGTEPAQ